MIVALDQQHVGSEPCRGNCGSRSGRPAADHQYVGLGEHRHFALRLDNRFRGARAPREVAPLEKFDPDSGANAAGVTTAARGSRKISLSLTERPAGGTSSFPVIPRLTANICSETGQR